MYIQCKAKYNTTGFFTSMEKLCYPNTSTLIKDIKEVLKDTTFTRVQLSLDDGHGFHLLSIWAVVYHGKIEYYYARGEDRGTQITVSRFYDMLQEMIDMDYERLHKDDIDRAEKI